MSVNGTSNELKHPQLKMFTGFKYHQKTNQKTTCFSFDAVLTPFTDLSAHKIIKGREQPLAV